MITLTPLFSGSSGNSTLIQTKNANILVDLGFGYRATLARLAEMNICPDAISAIVISHEHSDHIGALKSWTKKFHTKVFAPKELVIYLAQNCFCADIDGVDGHFEIFDASVETYRCSHDARACLGYRFSDAEKSVAIVTDTGVAQTKLVDFLAPCQTIMLESNHDPEMLWHCDYPEVLKSRIASELGHLSNVQATGVLKNLIGSNVKNVVLAHLSRQSNTKERALAEAKSMYEQNGIDNITLVVADQFKNEVTL